MPEIFIENLSHRVIPFSDTSRSLLHHLHTHYIDWMHTCGGKGRCTTCKAIIVKGEENLSALSVHEQRYRRNGGLNDSERLACQVKPHGPVVIRVPDENKLPHMDYSD